jgi:hypothetical protein
MFWILLLSVIANALLTLGVCRLLFRNGEVIEAAGRGSAEFHNQGRVTAKQVQHWLNSNRERITVVDLNGTSPAVPILECTFMIDHGALMIQTASSDD